MIVWGINALNHGSSLAVFEGDLLHSNRISHVDEPTYEIISDGLKHGYPELIHWYENPWIKKARQLRAGQWATAFDLSVLPKKFLDRSGFSHVPIRYTPHHASHAAAGFYTSPFKDATVVVLDAIGEFECATIWHGQGQNLKKVWSRNYPNSLGLFYSAFTQVLGMSPIVDEGKVMAMASQGDARRFYPDVSKYFRGTVRLNYNFHKGVRDQQFDLESQQDRADLAAAVQLVFEQQVDLVMHTAKTLTGCDSLIYMGGCAMNSLYNQRLPMQWKRLWSLPNPGDPSSSIGAVLYHTRQRISTEHLGVAKHLEIIV